MPSVSLCLYRGSGIGGWLVRKWTRSPYGHCSILVRDGVSQTVYEAVAQGVLCRPRGSPESRALVLPCPWVDAERAAAWLDSRLGLPYDWAAVLMSGVAMRWPGGYHLLDTRQGSWDCSRLAAACLGLIDYSQPCPPTPGWVYRRVRELSHKP